MKYEKWNGEGLGELKTEEEVRKHFKMNPDDVAYIVRDDDGNIMYFQYHAPHIAGLIKMKENTWKQYAQDHVAKIQDRITAIEKAKADGTYNLEHVI